MPVGGEYVRVVVPCCCSGCRCARNSASFLEERASLRNYINLLFPYYTRALHVRIKLALLWEIVGLSFIMHQYAQVEGLMYEAFAGLSAGVATTLVSHPLDLVKTRLQVDRWGTTRPGSAMRLARRAITEEGGLAALYRGLGANLIGNAASWAIYFVTYDSLKHFISSIQGDQKRLSYYHYFLASGIAGTFTTICTNPIWVVKTRMMTTASVQAGAYHSVADGIRRIYRLDGIAGYYRGLSPSLFGVIHGALQFMVYEQLKSTRYKEPLERRELRNIDILLCSGISKLLAGTITYPHQVIRSRLQIYDAELHYKGVRDVIIQLWKQEGLAGFYKGLGPNLLRIVPSSCVTFLVYENARLFLPGVIQSNGIRGG